MPRSGSVPKAERSGASGSKTERSAAGSREAATASPTKVTPGKGGPGKSRSRQPKPVIGWREWVRFPDLGVDAIKAKVDTGARTSSLHAFDLQQFEVDGQPRVRFVIHPEQDSSEQAIPVDVPLVARRHVRDSGGRAELRPVVEVTVELHGQRWPMELTLTRRDAMGFRMLLGRQAIRRRFVVDPGRSFLAGDRNRRDKSGRRS